MSETQKRDEQDKFVYDELSSRDDENGTGRIAVLVLKSDRSGETIESSTYVELEDWI